MSKVSFYKSIVFSVAISSKYLLLLPKPSLIENHNKYLEISLERLLFKKSIYSKSLSYLYSKKICFSYI